MGFCFDFQGRAFGPVDNGAPLFCIAGPCALESRAHALEVSAALKEIFAAAGVPFIYKSSFDKANRSSGASFRGVGMAEGLSILAEVRNAWACPCSPMCMRRNRPRLWPKWRTCFRPRPFSAVRPI